MKRKILLICLISVLLSLVSAGTYAYFTAAATATNAVSSGGLSFQLRETAADGSEYPSQPLIILPGDVVSKTVTVKNTGSHPMYLRVRLTSAINDPSLDAEGCMSPDINTSSWTFRDGYYYYNTALEANGTTEPLFTQLSFIGEKLTNAYMGKLLSLDVAVFAVQSEHNGTDPFSAQGWPEGKPEQ